VVVPFGHFGPIGHNLLVIAQDQKLMAEGKRPETHQLPPSRFDEFGRFSVCQVQIDFLFPSTAPAAVIFERLVCEGRN
jgi:hypothetical protein